MKRIWALTAIIGLILFSTSTATAQDARVFENALDFSGPLDTEVARITGLLEEGGFQVIASRDASVPGECSYDATVISVYDAAFSDAAFARRFAWQCTLEDSRRFSRIIEDSRGLSGNPLRKPSKTLMFYTIREDGVHLLLRH